LPWLSTDKIRHLAAILQMAYAFDVEKDFPDEMIRVSGHLNPVD